MGPPAAVAAVRLAVRRCLAAERSGGGLGAGDLVLAACSGGADSLALAAALAFEAPGLGLAAGGVTVDHGLQDGSAEQARQVTKTLTELGLDPVQCLTVTVARRDAGGLEAAARAARYAALDRAADAVGAAAILLGHTVDDQAETVLLGLARGSGTRSLAGMPERRGRCLRPLLGVSRAQTRAACAAQDLEPWDDPQNADPGFARARVRHRLLPAMEEELGPGVTEALARTARQLRADADFLDSFAKAESERIVSPVTGELSLDLVAGLPAAIRSRVLRNAAIAAGCPAGALTAGHVAGLDALVTGWRGQRWIDLPGGIRGRRRYGKLLLRAREGEDLGGRERHGRRPGGDSDHPGSAAEADRGTRGAD
jgi:tRNA(Ile)-lysidine synthase